jgi:RES domain-containing protein
MDNVIPTQFDGNVWRAVPETIKDKAGKVVAENTDDTVYNLHKGMKSANGRYSAPGESAIYTSIGKETDAWKTVMEELGEDVASQPLRLESKQYKLDRVLDLTDPKVRNELGVSGFDLIKKTERYQDAYEITHQIGNIAKKKGFKGLKVDSAILEGGINLIIFGD